MKNFKPFIQPILLIGLYVSLSIGLVTGGISYYIFGCSIIIEFLLLSILYMMASILLKSKRAMASIQVFFSTIFICSILYALLYHFSDVNDEFAPFSELGTAAPFDVMIFYRKELIIFTLAILISYSSTIVSLAPAKLVFDLEGMLIRKALMVFGTAILCVLALVLISTKSQLTMALVVVSIRLILEIIEVYFETKTH